MFQKLKHSASLAHPGTWWLVGFGVAIIAGQATSLVTVGASIIVSVSCILLFRTTAAWAQSLRFYLGLSVFVVLVRLVFRLIFSGGRATDDALFIDIPQIEINLGFGFPLRLFGEVGVSTMQNALLDGLRLAAIVLAIAMATTLSNPRRLLKLTPAALYEVAAAVSVAINLAPQLIESLQRVRKARALRGRNRGVGALTSIVIPALEDTMDRSLQLAASMDARGFGRRGKSSSSSVLLTRVLSLLSAVGLAIGTYLLLTLENPQIAVAVLVASLLLMVIVVRVSSKRNLRTSFERERLKAFDYTALTLLAFAICIVFLNQGGFEVGQ